MEFLRHSSRRLLPLSLLFLLCLQNGALGAPQVPCYFIFGDSISDAGNNNNLISLAKVNNLPYGIDFPDGPTGRFTNGPTIVDFIARLLGFDRYIQNFMNALANQDFMRGVNYASGAAGIRDETGIQQGDRISLNRQLSRHFFIIKKIRTILGDQAAESLLNKCIYTVGMGNNDYINNYFMRQSYLSSRIYTPQQFAEELAKQYAQQLTALYVLGARKVAIVGPGLIGCAPQVISTHGATNGSSCNKQLNDAVILFNNQFRPLIQRLNNDFPNATFTFIDMISIASSSAAHPSPLNSATPCCETIPSLGTCKPNGTLCAMRDRYAFFDGFHPTQIVNQGLADRCYNKVMPSDVYPFDIHHLVTS